MGAAKDRAIDTPKPPEIKKPAEIIEEQLFEREKKLSKMFPIPMKVDHFIYTAMIQITQRPLLLECTRESLLTCVACAAEVGLDYTPDKKHVYLIPYKDNKTGHLVATNIFGYQAFVEVATRSGKVSKIEARLVYENEKFEIQYGTDPKITHIPLLKDRGDIVGVYGVAWMYPSGVSTFDYMTREEIDRIKGFAKTQKFWNEHEGEMTRKTIVRRLHKYLPSTPDIANLIRYDNDMYDLSKAQQQDEEQPRTRGESIMKDLGIAEEATEEQTETPESDNEPDPKQDKKNKDPGTMEILQSHLDKTDEQETIPFMQD